MVYRSYEDLANCIRQNLWKLPLDTDIIVGVPRSGMIPALMIAEYLNKPCADLDGFMEGRMLSYGTRGGMMKECTRVCMKVVVMDDCVCSGKSIDEVRERLVQIADKYEIVYGCVYAEGEYASQHVDFFFEDITQSDKVYIKEWNALHLFKNRMKSSMWDVDGLLSKDPPEDKNLAKYEAYLHNAIPMIIPTNYIGAFVTYRLEKYRKVTEDWLRKHGIKYGQLIMYNAPSIEARNIERSSAYKARIYKGAVWAKLFYESSRKQAERIFEKTGKPVFCYENGKLYM